MTFDNGRDSARYAAFEHALEMHFDSPSPTVAPALASVS